MRTEKLMAAFLGLSLFAASSGLTSAYLHSYPEILQNIVTAGTLDVKLTEPSWDPTKATGLVPGSTVPKDPAPVNTGDHDAWIFLRLSVPVKHISLVNRESRRREPAKDVPLFSFAASDRWELIGQTAEKDAVNYVYGYKTLVKPQEKTSALFENVTLVNYLEGELLADDALTIPAEAVAIQDKVCPAGASLAEIYQMYLEQEGKS